MKFSFTVLFLLGSALGCASAEGLPRGFVISQRNQEAVLKFLRPVLMARGGAGRLYYSTVCESKDKTSLPFPTVDARRPSTQLKGLAAVRDIFRNDKNVTVSQDRSRMIRVTIGKPASALPQTRIHSVTFNQSEQYNPELAIFGILNSKDVETAMHQLGFDQPVTVFGGSINVPEKGVPLPHLPASMKNVTMDEALDVIARTFGGIVIYETCAEAGGKRLVSLEFVEVMEL